MPTSEALEFDVLSHQFRNTAWTKPAALYVGLLLATPDDEGGLVEVPALEYDRVARHPSDANWLLAQDGRVLNAEAITFAAPTTDWGTVKAVALFDAAQAGILRAWQELDNPKSVVAGGPLLMFQPGGLSWRMTDLKGA